MELDLWRRPSTDLATFGELFINGRFRAFTLEDVVRLGEKIAHETAIPSGRYQMIITPSQRFHGQRLPLLVDVPGFTGVRLHAGNTQEDTSGCILVGQEAMLDRLGQSRLALESLMPILTMALAEGEAVWLTIHPAGTTRPVDA